MFSFDLLGHAWKANQVFGSTMLILVQYCFFIRQDLKEPVEASIVADHMHLSSGSCSTVLTQSNEFHSNISSLSRV